MPDFWSSSFGPGFRVELICWMDLVERCNRSPTESSPSSLVRDVVDLSEFVIVGLENKELGQKLLG